MTTTHDTQAATTTPHPATQPGRLIRRYLDQATAEHADTTWSVRLLEITRLLRPISHNSTQLAVSVSRKPRRATIHLIQTDYRIFDTTGYHAPTWLTSWHGSQGQTWDDVRTTIEDHLNAALATTDEPGRLWSRATAEQLRAWETSPSRHTNRLLWTVRLLDQRAVQAYDALDQAARRPAAPLDAMHAIVAEFLADELADYLEQDGPDQPGHPYRHLLSLNNWLEQLGPGADLDDAPQPHSINPDVLEQILTAHVGHNAAQTILSALDTAHDVPPDIDPELRGSMRDGYDADTVNTTLGHINAATGAHVICLWDYRETVISDFYGGDSNFHIVHNGHVHELAGDLYDWLNGDPHDPDTALNPGTPDTWTGAPTTHTLATLPAHDGRLNYATHTR